LRCQTENPICFDTDDLNPRTIAPTVCDGDRRGELNSPDVKLFSGVCNTPPQSLPALRSPSNNIGAIIRGYKSAVTKQANLMDFGGSVWQRSFHEHIIRDEASYQKISGYIIDNVSTWQEDKFYIE